MQVGPAAVLHRTVNVEEAPLHVPLAGGGVLATGDDKLLPTVPQLVVTSATDRAAAAATVE